MEKPKKSILWFDEIGIEEDDDGSFYAEVSRKELETDEEFEERKQSAESMRILFKQRRHQQYLKLKEEFEK
jgi:heat shock protein HspQ